MNASADSADSNLTERMAVFRYGLISRLLPQDLSDEQRRNELKRILDNEHTIPRYAMGWTPPRLTFSASRRQNGSANPSFSKRGEVRHADYPSRC